jgi:YD repeat-containing protein
MKRLSSLLIIFALFLQSPTPSLGENSPKIVTTPECIIFYATESQGNPANQTFKISNGGGGTLNYTLTTAASWVYIDKAFGSVTTGEDTITVSVDASGLSENQSPYISDIIVTNADDPSQKKIVNVRLSIISPESYAKAYAYDQNGNLLRRVTPKGDIIEYKYDALSRLTHIYYPDGNSVSYAYDNNGNRTSMTDKSGTTQFSYDTQNRLIAVYFPNINPVVYTYDKTGNIIKIEYPDHSTVSYVYNIDNKLETVTDSTGITTYAYYSNTGLLHTKTLPNGVITTYTYDSAKRITIVDNRGSGGALISSYNYAYDANGNIISAIETSPQGSKTTTYIYDKLNRLKTVTYPDERGTVTYECDAAGNRTKMVTPQGTTNYKYDADNRLIRAGKEIFFYDKAGNLIKKVSAGKTITYAYDYDNRLIRYQDNTNTVEFEYDGDGRRISKTVNGARTNYVNDILRNPVEVIIEADASWHLTKVYRYGLDRLSQEEF